MRKYKSVCGGHHLFIRYIDHLQGGFKILK